jgi:hypothetical protein
MFRSHKASRCFSGLFVRARESPSNSATSPDDACAEVDDWYGMTLQVDIKPETLRKVEPLYRRALELRQGNATNPGLLAPSLELEAMALFDPADAPRARLMRDQARQLRASRIQALQATPVLLSSTPLVSPGPIYKVGASVVSPAITYRSVPTYSEEARLLKWSGTVRFSFIVDASGRPRSIQLVSFALRNPRQTTRMSPFRIQCEKLSATRFARVAQPVLRVLLKRSLYETASPFR